MISNVNVSMVDDKHGTLELMTLNQSGLSKIRAKIEKYKFYIGLSARSGVLSDAKYVPVIKEKLSKKLKMRIFKGTKGYYLFDSDDIKVYSIESGVQQFYKIILPFDYYTTITSYLDIFPIDVVFVIISKSANDLHWGIKPIISMVDAEPLVKEYNLQWMSLFQSYFPEVYRRIRSTGLSIESWYEVFIGFLQLELNVGYKELESLQTSYRISTSGGLREYIPKAIEVLNRMGVKTELYNAYAEQRAMEM